MLAGMKRFIVFIASLCLPATALAEELQISASAPIEGLPAVSTDGKSFVRPVRVQPTGCTGVQTFIEIGTVGSPTADPKTSLLLVKDECGKSVTTNDQNIESVNATLSAKKYKSVGKMQTMSLPAEIDLPTGTFKVAASGGLTCDVGIAGSSSDRWSVKLDGEVTEVRGWYSGKNAAGVGYVAIEISTDCDDTGRRGRERWIDFWPAGAAAGTASSDGGTPTDVAARWLAALKAKDATALSSASSTPFWKAGLTPISGKLKKKCKKQQKAKSDKQLRGVASCMVAAGSLYSRFTDDASHLSEIDMSEFPTELKKHKKKVAKLLAGGHKMVRYFLNDQGYYINLVFILDPDTDYQTVVVVLESVELEDE